MNAVAQNEENTWAFLIQFYYIPGKIWTTKATSYCYAFVLLALFYK